MKPRIALFLVAWIGAISLAVACNSINGLNDFEKVDCVEGCSDAQPEVAPDAPIDVTVDEASAKDVTVEDAATEPETTLPEATPFDGAPLERRWARWPMPAFLTVADAGKEADSDPEAGDLDAANDADANEAGVPNQAYYLDVEVDAGSGVQDAVTTMIWMKDANGSAKGNYAMAAGYCKAPWTMPTRIELVTLLKLTVPPPYIHLAAFPGTKGMYWTSSPDFLNKGDQWAVDFDTGEVSHQPRELALGVLCVQPMSNLEGHYYLFGPTSTTVLDNKTKLEWKRVVDPAAKHRPGAVTDCAAMASSGKPWRLPTLQELQTLVDEIPHQEYESGGIVWKAIDQEAFPGTPSDNFWSSSDEVLPGGGLGGGFVVNFQDGSAKTADPASAWALVRCVRTNP